MKSALLLLAPSIVAAAVPPIFARAGCNDNCARAIVAKAYATRSGSADCAAYFRTTVTPSAVTVLHTVTESFTPTATLELTETTSTTTLVRVSEVATEAVTAGKTITLVERDEQATIPAYASACSGVARYSTACACVGVSTVLTITATAPIETSTVFVSVSSTTTQTTTVSTETVLLTATSVESTTTTETVSQPTPTGITIPDLFALQAVGGRWNGMWAKANYYGATPLSISFALVSPVSGAAHWTFNGPEQGRLYYSDPSNDIFLPLRFNANAPGEVRVLDEEALNTSTNGDWFEAECSTEGYDVVCHAGNVRYDTWTMVSGMIWNDASPPEAIGVDVHSIRMRIYDRI